MRKIRIFLTTVLVLALACFLTACQFTIDPTHAEENLREFASRTHTIAIDCPNQDSDGNNYLTCVVQEPAQGNLIAVECPWRPYNTGCRLSKQYVWTLAPQEARDILAGS